MCKISIRYLNRLPVAGHGQSLHRVDTMRRQREQTPDTQDSLEVLDRNQAAGRVADWFTCRNTIRKKVDSNFHRTNRSTSDSSFGQYVEYEAHADGLHGDRAPTVF